MFTIANLSKTTLSDLIEYVNIVLEDLYSDLEPHRATAEDYFAAGRLMSGRETLQAMWALDGPIARGTLETALDEAEVELLESVLSEFNEQREENL